MATSPLSIVKPKSVGLALLMSCFVAGANAADLGAPACEQDPAVLERFIPVELLNGLPLEEAQELRFGTVDRSYAFVDVLPDGRISSGTVALKGPLKWTGAGGKEHTVYERQVPRAHERFALTPDGTAIGRVYDQRIGNISNEGKFPVGIWKQGQKRTYYTFYDNRNAVSTLEMEKIACTYDGIANSMQYRWKTNTGLEYGYIYAPGRGLVQVFTYKSGR